MLRTTLYAVVVAVSTLCTSLAFAADLPNLAPPRFDTAFAVEHKQDILDGLEKSGDVINFGGRFTFVSLPCGDNCQQGAAIDRLGEGEVIPFIPLKGKAVKVWFNAGSYGLAINSDNGDTTYYRLNVERGVFVPIKLKGTPSPKHLLALYKKYPAPFDPAWACNSTNQCE